MTQTPWDDVIASVASREAPQVGWSASDYAALLRAHMSVESNFDPTAYHWDGPNAEDNVSRGLMQIEGKTAKLLGLPTGADSDTISGPTAPRYNVPGRTTGMYDPYLAIPTGAHIITANLQRAGDLSEAIAAYNEGPTRAAEDAPGPYRDQAYVDHVLAAFDRERTASGDTVPPTPGAGQQGNASLTGQAMSAIVTIGLTLLVWWATRRR